MPGEPFPKAWADFGDIRVDGQPLEQLLTEWSVRSGVRLSADWTALAEYHIKRDTPVHLRLTHVKVATALDALAAALSEQTDVPVWDWGDDAKVTLTTPQAVVESPTVTLRTYDLPPALVRDRTPRGPLDDSEPFPERVGWLIRRLVDIDSWEYSGGAAGTIEYVHGRLFVRQTGPNQWLAANVLRALRHASADMESGWSEGLPANALAVPPEPR